MGLEIYDVIYHNKMRILVRKSNLHVDSVDNLEWSWSQYQQSGGNRIEHRCGTYIVCYDGVFLCPGCNKIVDFEVDIDKPKVKVIDV